MDSFGNKILPSPCSPAKVIEGHSETMVALVCVFCSLKHPKIYWGFGRGLSFVFSTPDFLTLAQKVGWSFMCVSLPQILKESQDLWGCPCVSFVLSCPTPRLPEVQNINIEGNHPVWVFVAGGSWSSQNVPQISWECPHTLWGIVSNIYMPNQTFWAVCSIRGTAVCPMQFGCAAPNLGYILSPSCFGFTEILSVFEQKANCFWE